MKNKIRRLVSNLKKYFEQIVSEEFEIIDRLYYECTQMNKLIKEGEAYG